MNFPAAFFHRAALALATFEAALALSPSMSVGVDQFFASNPLVTRTPLREAFIASLIIDYLAADSQSLPDVTTAATQK